MFHKNSNIVVKTWTPNIAKLQNKMYARGQASLLFTHTVENIYKFGVTYFYEFA